MKMTTSSKHSLCTCWIINFNQHTTVQLLDILKIIRVYSLFGRITVTRKRGFGLIIQTAKYKQNIYQRYVATQLTVLLNPVFPRGVLGPESGPLR
jgi:hypothetical protein